MFKAMYSISVKLKWGNLLTCEKVGKRSEAFWQSQNRESIYLRWGSRDRKRASAEDYHCGSREVEEKEETSLEDFLMRLGVLTTNTLWLDLHFIHF